MMRDAPVRRGWARVGDVGLTVAAIVGAVCIVLAVAAVLFDVRIVLFRTGSMSPTIPAGSAALVHRIHAADIAVGDIIMVERPGDLPVTHRVVGIETVGHDPDARSITMRGDANPVDDPAPYEVREARRIVGSVPGVAPVLSSMGSPWVMGSLTVAATALIVVVFWPKRRSHRGDPDAVPRDEAPPALGSRRARRMAGVGVAVGVLATGAPLAMAPMPAAAETTETVIQGSVIRLISIEEPAMRSLTPGRTATWQVGVTADASTPGTITITLAGTGDDASGLLLEVQGCAQQWTDAGCPTPELLVAETPIPVDGVARTLRSMGDDERLWLRLHVTMPEDAGSGVSDVQLVVRATGVGDDVSAHPGGGLAATGAGSAWGLIGAGVVLATAGVGVLMRARRRT